MGRIRVNLKSLRELVCFSILFEGCSTYKVALVSSQFLQDGPSVLWICFASSPWVSSFSVSSTVLACTPGLGYRLFANEVTSFGERLEAVWVFGPFCYERKKKKKKLWTQFWGREWERKTTSFIPSDASPLRGKTGRWGIQLTSWHGTIPSQAGPWLSRYPHSQHALFTQHKALIWGTLLDGGRKSKLPHAAWIAGGWARWMGLSRQDRAGWVQACFWLWAFPVEFLLLWNTFSSNTIVFCLAQIVFIGSLGSFFIFCLLSGPCSELLSSCFPIHFYQFP